MLLYEFFEKIAVYEGLEDFILVFLIVVSVFVIFALISYLLVVIGKWKIFKKAGVAGWKSFIPIYNTYLFCQICGINTTWVWISLICFFVSITIPLLSFISSVLSLYFVILQAVSLSKSFGKSEAFAIGLIFLSPIFYLILGCGKSKYIGPIAMNDIFFKENKDNVVNEKQSVNNFSNDTTAVGNARFCSQCGVEIDVNDLFCYNCGHKCK